MEEETTLTVHEPYVEDLITENKVKLPTIKEPPILYKISTEQKNKSTSNILTDYEYAQCISIRASEIERGHKIFTDYKGLYKPIDIAKKEFHEGKTPLILVRTIKTINDKR